MSKGWANCRVRLDRWQCGAFTPAMSAKGYMEANPVHAWRKLHNLSRKAAAKQIGCSSATVAHWEWFGAPNHGIAVFKDRFGLDIEEANEERRRSELDPKYQVIGEAVNREIYW